MEHVEAAGGDLEGNLAEVAMSSLRLAAVELDVDLLAINLTEYEHLRHVDAELLDGEAIVRAFGSWEVAKHAASTMGPAPRAGGLGRSQHPPLQP